MKIKNRQQCHLHVETFIDGIGQLYRHEMPRSYSNNQLEINLKIGENQKAYKGNYKSDNERFEYEKLRERGPLWNTRLKKINKLTNG